MRLLFSILLVSIASVGSAQEHTESILQVADRFYSENNFDAAVTEYMRFRFFAPNHELAYYAAYKQGLALSALGDFAASSDALAAAYRGAANPKHAEVIRYRLAVMLFRAGNLEVSKLTLLQLTFGGEDEVIKANSAILLGLIHAFQENWPSARSAFKLARDSMPDNPDFVESLANVDSILVSLIERPNVRSPRFAKWSSTVLPGSGQIYAGNYSSGLVAMSLNAGTGALVVRSVRRRAIRNTFLLITNLWWRYYQGNRLHAKEHAIHANYRYHEKVAQDLYFEVEHAAQLLSNDSIELDLEIVARD